MKIINKKTVYTFEISDLDRLMLMGLIYRVINKETLPMDEDATQKFKEILEGLSSTN